METRLANSDKVS